MLYLYLDESGDLGFDFINKKPGHFFTICVLSVRGRDNDRALAKSVKEAVRRKLPAVYSATLDKISVCRGFSPEKRQDI